MAHPDRADIVRLLERLGDEDREAVLDAARELHRRVTESGPGWNDLLRTQWGASGAAQTGDRDEAAPEERSAAGDPGRGGEADKAETLRLIGRLMARKDLSDTTREELTEFKRSIAEGSLDEMDSRYVRALAKRLGV